MPLKQSIINIPNWI